MSDLTISVEVDAIGTRRGSAEAKSAIKGIGDEAEKSGRKIKSIAERDMGALDKQAAAAAKSVTATSGSLSGLAAIGGPASAIIAAIGAAMLVVVTVAIALAHKIVELTMAFVGYVKEIKSARDELGLTAQVLSGLRVGIESVGGKFADLTSGLKNYIKTIGDANNGSKEASAKLVRLGIDADGAGRNFDGALRQVFAKIASLPEGVQRTNAAIDAFGDSVGPKLLPMITQFNGNIDEMVAQAKKLGLVMSEDDVRAAAEFEKSLASVKLSVKALEVAFGREFMPVVKMVLDNVNIWLLKNKDEWHLWATSSGNAVVGLMDELNQLKDWVADNWSWFELFMDVTSLGLTRIARKGTYNVLSAAGEQGGMLRGVGQLNPDFTMKDPSAPAISPQTGLMYNNPGIAGPGKTPKIPKVPKVASPKISDEAKQAETLRKMLKDLQIEVDHFGQDSEEAGMKQRLLKMEIFATNSALQAQLIALAKDKDGKIASAKATEDLTKQTKIITDLHKGIEFSDLQTKDVLNNENDQLQQQISLGRELTEIEKLHFDNKAALIALQHQNENQGFSDNEVAAAEQVARLSQQKVTAARLLNIELKETRRIQELNKQMSADMSAEIEDLNAQLRENSGLTALTRVETLLLSDAYKQLTPEMQKARLEQAQQIDILRETIKAQQEAQRQWDEMFGVIRDSLGVLAEQGFGAFFKNVLRKFQQFALDLVSAWLTSKFFQVFGQNGGILGVLMNGSSGAGSSGPGGTPNWNPASGTIAVPPPGTVAPPPTSGSGGFFGAGGIFGAQGFGNNVGTYGAIGSFASVAGGMIGGRVGGFISGAGAGLAIGAQIGSMIMPGIGTAIGAVVGAIGGGLLSLLGGDPKRKRDKKEKMPQLEKGFLDALTQLKALAADKNAILSNPSGAMAKADELRAAIAAGFGIQFESKKYGKIAQQQIALKVAEADILVKQIKEFAEVSRAANERDRRLIPEFAGGVYMSPAFMSFRRRNGMLGGQFTGRDTIPAMLAHGEAVLNPRQMATIRSQAGFDVFKSANIPGYASGAMVSTQQSAVSSQPMNISLHFEHSIDAEGMVRTQLKSSSGVQKDIHVVVSDGFANDGIKTKRRGG